jgi:hypothetical protein
MYPVTAAIFEVISGVSFSLKDIAVEDAQTSNYDVAEEPAPFPNRLYID